jgi:hypothetical protein
MRLSFIAKPDTKQLSTKRVLKDSLLLSVLMTGLILIVARVNPDILSRGEVDEKTKKQRTIFFIPSLTFLFGIPLLSNILLRKQNKGELSFANAFLNAYSIGGFVNLFDLLILDYLLVLIWKPGFIKSLAKEADPMYSSYSFHFKAFLRGMVIILVPSLLAAILGRGRRKR